MNTIQIEQRALAMAAIKAHFDANRGIQFTSPQLCEQLAMQRTRLRWYLRELVVERFIEKRGARSDASYIRPVDESLAFLAGTPFRAFMGRQALMDSWKAT